MPGHPRAQAVCLFETKRKGAPPAQKDAESRHESISRADSVASAARDTSSVETEAICVETRALFCSRDGNKTRRKFRKKPADRIATAEVPDPLFFCFVQFDHVGVPQDIFDDGSAGEGRAQIQVEDAKRTRAASAAKRCRRTTLMNSSKNRAEASAHERCSLRESAETKNVGGENRVEYLGSRRYFVPGHSFRDGELRLATLECDLNCARLGPWIDVDTARCDTCARKLPDGPTSQQIASDSAHEPTFGPQCRTVIGDIGCRPAQKGPIREYVPKQFAPRNDPRVACSQLRA